MYAAVPQLWHSPRACSGLHCQPQVGLKPDLRQLSSSTRRGFTALEGRLAPTGADKEPSTVRAAVHGLLAVLLTLGKLGAAATTITAGQPAAIVAAAPARLRIVAPTSPRGEVTGPACANRTLCAVPRALMAATTRGGLGVSRSSPGPTGAYPGHSQQGHTIPVPRVTSPRVARCNLAEQLLMAAGPLLWLFGSMALLDSVVWRLPFTPQPAAAIPVGIPESASAWPPSSHHASARLHSIHQCPVHTR